MYVRNMQAGAGEAVAGLRAAFDAFASCDFASLSRDELLAVLDEYETLTCQMPAVWHRLLAQLQAGATAKELGAKSWNEVLRIRWRLSTAEAGRRLAEAGELGPRRALTGEVLPAVLPAVAAAQRAAGLINTDHVKVLRDAVHHLPEWVDTTTREQFELDLVRVAVGVGPKELKETAELRLFLLDQDGPEPDDTERARKRGVNMAKQGRDAMTGLTADLTPEAAAVWEVLLAKFAAPGMCNPDDDEPCTTGTPTQAQIDNDHRTLAQRQHDALLVIGRIALMSGDLGQLNGLPVSVIIRTTLQDLESRAGIGVTGGGRKLPITDVIRMGGHANHHLAIFDHATGAALDYYRARRTASAAQRIMLIARDGGCTKPGCTVGAYGCQVHHAAADWSDGGNTNVDEMTLACGPDNRLVNSDNGYTTTINERGDVEWHPPPDLDHSQQRINYHHRPELLLTPPDEEPEPDHTPDPEPEWVVTPEPGCELAPDAEQAPQPARVPELIPEPEPDVKQHPEWVVTPEPGCELAPDAEHDSQWHPEPDPQWDLDWDTDFDPPAPTPPNVEHLWDAELFAPEPSAPQPVDPGLPTGWTLLDPSPRLSINDHALSGKAARGP
ncbi:DUF222 domain-containing protein [Mycolicibacterium sp. XJ870]